MSFEDQVLNYFKVGEHYTNSYGKIVTCIGFTSNTNCNGFHCAIHSKFGMCDGSIKPVFKEHKRGHCAYTGNGGDWFTHLEGSNLRW